jgi:hypothetical protein
MQSFGEGIKYRLSAGRTALVGPPQPDLAPSLPHRQRAFSEDGQTPERPRPSSNPTRAVQRRPCAMRRAAALGSDDPGNRSTTPPLTGGRFWSLLPQQPRHGERDHCVGSSLPPPDPSRDPISGRDGERVRPVDPSLGGSVEVGCGLRTPDFSKRCLLRPTAAFPRLGVP